MFFSDSLWEHVTPAYPLWIPPFLLRSPWIKGEKIKVKVTKENNFFGNLGVLSFSLLGKKELIREKVNNLTFETNVLLDRRGPSNLVRPRSPSPPLPLQNWSLRQ